MTITTLSSRELNQDVTRAKKATSKRPVIITDRGKPAHVLLRFEDYQKLTQQRARGPDRSDRPRPRDDGGHAQHARF
jgi:PHD/YefM family antitoxin component YafN of YafNO toxin-antitoxin module